MDPHIYAISYCSICVKILAFMLQVLWNLADLNLNKKDFFILLK